VDITPLISAGIAVIGTLSGVLLTLRFNRRIERERRAEERASRWLDKRLDICRQLLLLSVRVERKEHDLLSFLLDDSETGTRMRETHSTILITPEVGLPGIIDPLEREILVEGIRECMEMLNEADELQAELSLLREGDVVTAAVGLVDALWDVLGHLEIFGRSSAGYAAGMETRRKREEFNEVARRDLGLVVDLQDTPRRLTAATD